jgi:hypothetical protein
VGVAAEAVESEDSGLGDWRRGLVAGALAWLVPGAGHLYLRRPGRAAIFFAVIAVAAYTGWRLDGNLPLFDQPGPLNLLKALTAVGLGIPYAALRFGLDYTGDPTAAGYEYGSAFLLSAGLMNLLLVLDCWDIGRGEKD